MYLVSKTSLIFLATQIGPCECGCKRHHMEWGEKDGTLPYIRFQCTNMHVFLWSGDFPKSMDTQSIKMKKLEIDDCMLEETRKAIKSLSVGTQTDHDTKRNHQDEPLFQFSPNQDEGLQVLGSIKEVSSIIEKESDIKVKGYVPEERTETKQKEQILEKELTEAGLWTTLFEVDKEKNNGFLEDVEEVKSPDVVDTLVDTYDSESEEDNGTLFEDLSPKNTSELEETKGTREGDAVCDSVIAVSSPEGDSKLKDSGSERKGAQDLEADIPHDNQDDKVVEKQSKRTTIAKNNEKPVLVNPSECYDTIPGDMGKRPDFEQLQEEKIYRCLTCFTLCDSIYAKQKHTNKHIGRYFLCKMCKQRRQTREAIKNHILSAHSWKRYHCDMCGYKSAMKARLNQHIMEVHQQNKKFQCSLCEKSFMSKKKLLNHEKVHQKVSKPRMEKEKIVLKEMQNDEQYTGLYEIGKEKISSQNIPAVERLKCLWQSEEILQNESKNCTVIQCNSPNLDENQNDFQGLESKSINSFQDISNKNLADFIPNMDALALNYDSFDPLKQPPDGSSVNVMPDLGKSFDLTKLLETVSQKDVGFEILTDPYPSDKSESFKEQGVNLATEVIDNFNIGKSDQRIPDTLGDQLHEVQIVTTSVNEPGVTCNIQEIIEKRNDSDNVNVLKDDTLLDSSTPRDISVIDKTKKETNTFTCPNPECSKTFKFRANMHRHLQRVHIKDKKFLCEQCGKGFATSADRTSHTKSVHTDTRMFQCEWPHCGKTFKSKKTLDVHKRVHEEVRHLQCSLCDYTCRQKASLNWHMKKKH